MIRGWGKKVHDFSYIGVKIHKPPVIVMNRPA
jgi:hypothetical protein